MTCYRCEKKIVKKKDDLGTGYGIIDGMKYCYKCCGELDREHLKTLKHGEFMVLYMTDTPDKHVMLSNWPGTFRLGPFLAVRKKVLAFGKLIQSRYVVFEYEGQRYYARNQGDMDCCRVRAYKNG